MKLPTGKPPQANAASKITTIEPDTQATVPSGDDVAATSISQAEMAAFDAVPGEEAAGGGSSKSANALFPDSDEQEEAGLAGAEVESDAVAHEEAKPFGRLDLPPAVELRYDVKASIKQRVTQGHGRIAWHAVDGAYRVQGEAGVLFFNVLEFSSEGIAGPGGVAPERYREKRFRKTETMTHLDRAGNRIRFSASQATFERLGTEQDRASVVWQLAAMARGDPDAFVPGRQFAMTVAAVRRTEIWSLRLIGLEDIVVSGRTMRGWRVQREPLPGSDDQRIDFWLAPDLEWYPIRIRYSEANGDWLEMSLASLPQPAALQRAALDRP